MSIIAVMYNKDNMQLSLEFANHNCYVYLDVPHNIGTDMLYNDNLGKYHAEHIRGHYRYYRVY